MDSLAAMLIQLDITPAHLSDAARAAFVKAAATIARKKSSGRPHFAKIAALTGIPRSEVRRLLQSHDSFRLAFDDRAPRALRVLEAWRRTPQYLIRRAPRDIRMRGPAPSFEALCKKFSGDIPHKVIADDLLARGAIQVLRVRNRAVVSVVRQSDLKDATKLGTIAFTAAFLRAVSSGDSAVIRRRKIVTAPKNLATSYFEKAVIRRVTSMIDEMPFESKRQPKKRRQESLEVFAMVAKEKD